MRLTIERMEEIVAKAKSLNHTHIRMMPSENMIYTGHKIQDGWKWVGVKE